MKESPQLMGVIAASAVVGGLALSRALTTGGTVAWCVTTACAMITLFALVAAVQYLRWVTSSDQRTAADVFFDDWPEELDVLVSNADEELRALAAAKVGSRYDISHGLYRRDAIRILQHVACQPETPLKVKASAIGALSGFGIESCPSAILDLAANPKGSPYLLQACWTYLAKTAANRTKLDEFLRAMLPAYPHLQDYAVAAVLAADASAKTSEERMEVREWMGRLFVESAGFHQAEARLSQHKPKFGGPAARPPAAAPEPNANAPTVQDKVTLLVESLLGS